jgi:tetratricopeptide (TPR) repeat protein
MLKAWREIGALTRLPEDEALQRLQTMVAGMDEAAFVLFRNAMILVNATYGQRGDLAGTEALQYERFVNLRCALENLRKPKDRQPPYTAEELELSARCNQLFNRLATALNNAAPGVASPAVADELGEIVEEHRKLLAEASPDNRGRRQALEAIAEATYARGRVYLIVRNYREAEGCFQRALEAFTALGDEKDAQASRQQLAGLVNLSGNLDAGMRANLEILTGETGQGRSLSRAAALTSQLVETVRVGDAFEAAKLVKAAIAELERQLYVYPGMEAIEPAFARWIEMVPSGLQGNDFLRELAQVAQLYSAIYGAQATLDPDSRAEQQLRILAALMDPMFEECFQADADLQQRFAAASARPLAADEMAAAS